MVSSACSRCCSVMYSADPDRHPSPHPLLANRSKNINGGHRCRIPDIRREFPGHIHCTHSRNVLEGDERAGANVMQWPTRAICFARRGNGINRCTDRGIAGGRLWRRPAPAHSRRLLPHSRDALASSYPTAMLTLRSQGASCRPSFLHHSSNALVARSLLNVCHICTLSCRSSKPLKRPYAPFRRNMSRTSS